MATKALKSGPRPNSSAMPMNGMPVNGSHVNGASAYEIMASRIASRIAELAENMTIVERQPPKNNLPAPPLTGPSGRKQPRKLEIRLPNGKSDTVSFSAPFLDNTLAKMLSLQNRMLKVGSDLAKSEDVDEQLKQEQFAQSAELSRIIALICAEKARQGA